MDISTNAKSALKIGCGSIAMTTLKLIESTTAPVIITILNGKKPLVNPFRTGLKKILTDKPLHLAIGGKKIPKNTKRKMLLTMQSATGKSNASHVLSAVGKRTLTMKIIQGRWMLSGSALNITRSIM